MGNCLKSFQNQTGQHQRSNSMNSGTPITISSNSNANATNSASTTSATAITTGSTTVNTSALKEWHQKHGIKNDDADGQQLLNSNHYDHYSAIRKSDISKTNDRSQESDELLPKNKSLKADNNCDKKNNSFKKQLNHQENDSSTSDMRASKANKRKASNMSEISDNTLNKLFEDYKDSEEDMILAEGIISLCQDLNYKPDEFAILVLAWCLDASQMCRFTRTEFIGGLHKMHADSIPTIRTRLEQTIQILKKNSEMFKQLYRFTFRFGLEQDQRILALDMAISLWKLVFTVHTPNMLDNWIKFLEQNPSIRGIPKDTWNMFLNFSEQYDIYNYDDTEAWPSLFDDFVDYEKARLADERSSAMLKQDDDNNNMDEGHHSYPEKLLSAELLDCSSKTNTLI